MSWKHRGRILVCNASTQLLVAFQNIFIVFAHERLYSDKNDNLQQQQDSEFFLGHVASRKLYVGFMSFRKSDTQLSAKQMKKNVKEESSRNMLKNRQVFELCAFPMGEKCQHRTFFIYLQVICWSQFNEQFFTIEELNWQKNLDQKKGNVKYLDIANKASPTSWLTSFPFDEAILKDIVLIIMWIVCHCLHCLLTNITMSPFKHNYWFS